MTSERDQQQQQRNSNHNNNNRAPPTEPNMPQNLNPMSRRGNDDDADTSRKENQNRKKRKQEAVVVEGQVVIPDTAASLSDPSLALEYHQTRSSIIQRLYCSCRSDRRSADYFDRHYALVIGKCDGGCCRGFETIPSAGWLNTWQEFGSESKNGSSPWGAACCCLSNASKCPFSLFSTSAFVFLQRLAVVNSRISIRTLSQSAVSTFVLRQ
jgi:hypothetical protein